MDHGRLYTVVSVHMDTGRCMGMGLPCADRAESGGRDYADAGQYDRKDAISMVAGLKRGLYRRERTEPGRTDDKSIYGDRWTRQSPAFPALWRQPQ